MKRALIDPNNNRVCEVVTPGDEFEVAAPLFWTNADDSVTPDTHRYEGGSVVAIDPPTPSRILTPRQFRQRLTQAEQDAIMTAALSNADVLAWRCAAAEAQEIDLDHPDTAAGLAFLQSLGLLTAERVVEIMG